MPSVYYIPSGPANLQSMFGAIDFNQVEEYYLEIIGGGTIGTTPHFNVIGCKEDVTVTYVNHLGAIDSIPLTVTVESDVKSGSYQRPTSYPLIKSEHGITRNNIKANKVSTGKITLPENQLPILEEYNDTPAAWQQQNGDYIPVVVSDQKITILKDTNRFAYDVSVEFSLSHERIVLNN